MVTRGTVWGLLGLAAMLAGCVSYEPAPLERTPHLATTVQRLDQSGPGPISLRQLDRLVLANNPDLAAARARRGIVGAQLIAAEILPNPQVTASYPFYVAGPGGSDGFGLALAQDLKSLLLRPTRREAARAQVADIDASILWQEWQTIGKARMLFVDLVAGERSTAILGRNLALLKERYAYTDTSIRQGVASVSALSPDLVAVGDVERASDELARLQLVRRHELNALLGLAPDARVRLAAAAAVPPLDAARVRVDLASLADRRPDLIALQYGYRAEDAKLRQAILGQFPNLVIGLAGGRDTSAIYSVGPQATFELPIFDRNEGNLAVEAATREALQREFAARLTTAAGEIEATLSEYALLRRQLDALETRLKAVRAAAEKSETAYRQGNFDERAYVEIEVARLNREQEKIGLQQILLERQVALATLTGAGMPHLTIRPEAPPSDPFGLLHAVR